MEAIRAGDIAGVQLRLRRRLPVATRKDLWPWLVEAGRLEMWLADDVEVSGSRPDGLELRGEAFVERARTVSIDRPKSWILDFIRRDAGWTASTRVTLESAMHADGCELSVLHQGFQHLSLSICLSVWEEYRRRWAEALERLDQALTARSGG